MVGRVALGLALSAASALMLHVSFPPNGLWPLVLVGFVPMLVAKYRVMPPRLSSLAPAVTIGGWFALWMLPVFGGSGSWMSWIPLGIFLLSFLLDRGDRAFHERTLWRWFVVEGAVAWLGIEMIRSLVPVMGTWGFVGYPLGALPWLVQPASVLGIFGLDLLVMLVNYALGLSAIAIVDGVRPPGAAAGNAAGAAVPAALVRRWGTAVAALAAAWTAASLGLYFRPERSEPVRVAAVQVPGRGAGGMSYEKDPARREALLAQLVEGTRAAARDGAGLVVWPEGALDFDPAVSRTAEISALARETGAWLVVGYLVEVPGGWRNEAVTVDPSGTVLAAYGKDHPVVFGGERGTSLHAYPVHETPFGGLGTIICYDLDFTDTARKVARAGAGIVAVPSLDWTAIAGRHSAHLVLRAVENRAAMVKADGGYDSLIVDARGQVAARTVTPQGAAAVLVADVRPGTADAPAIRLGDGVGWLCLAGFAFFAAFKPLAVRRAARKGGPT